ncbi:MAG TPA: YlxR family protein [Candidatus Dormibacteraeota bacterium]|nr:YlxR family protein [Candidatus Dormibacteraeota bacterium]
MPPSRGHVPTRTCVACRTERPKWELVRLVKAADAPVVVDPTGKLNGRGAYLCHDPACWTQAQRRKAVERALKVSLDEAAWQNLLSSRPAEGAIDS